MKNKLLTILAAGTLLASNQFSLADCCFQNTCCPSNWYVAASGSVAWHNDVKFPNKESTGSFDYKTGGGAAASIGYIFDMCCCDQWWDLRLELEGVWRRNSLNNITINTPRTRETESASGHTQNFAIMANLIADFPLFCNINFYLGGGLGVSFNDFTGQSARRLPRFKSTDNLFAWQALTGLSYDVCPNIALTAGYRIFGTNKLETNKGIESDRIPLTQSIDIGIRFKL